jgi:hypothetical protein
VASSLAVKFWVGRAVATVLTVGGAEIAASICVRVNSVVGSLFDRPEACEEEFWVSSPGNNGYSVPLIVVRHSGYMHPVS